MVVAKKHEFELGSWTWEVSDVTITPSSVVPMQNFGKLPRKATVILSFIVQRCWLCSGGGRF